LRLLAIIPEIFRGHQAVDFRQPFLHAGDVKETSANAPIFPRRRSTAFSYSRTWLKISGKTADSKKNSPRISLAFSAILMEFDVTRRSSNIESK